MIINFKQNQIRIKNLSVPHVLALVPVESVHKPASKKLISKKNTQALGPVVTVHKSMSKLIRSTTMALVSVESI